MGKKDYRRWGYEDETEISMEEQLTLEDHDYDHGRETPTSTTTFSQSNLTLTASHIQRKKNRNTGIKEKVQLVCLSAVVLMVGFITGFSIGVRDFNKSNSSTINTHSEPQGKFTYEDNPETSYNNMMYPSPAPSLWSSHETNEPSFYNVFSEISADNIRQNLKRMSQEVQHSAGTPEGKSMAISIRDSWRKYGLSVRVEKHNQLLTKANGFSYAEVLDRNGSVVFSTSKIGDGVNLPNARPTPMIAFAFSPAADLNGTLIFGMYGRREDFDFLRSSRIALNRSIALIRFGGPHPSKVAAVASAYGIKGLLFYPDPQDYGSQLPPSAIRRSSLLTLGQIHEYQKHKSKSIIPAHTISFSDAEQLLRSMKQGGSWMKKAPAEWQGGLKTTYFLGPGVQFSHSLYSSSSSSPSKHSPVQIRLRIFNEPKTSSIFNVVAAIPGAWESDRYVIIGCSHDSWSYGAGEPGLGLALISEIARSFSTAVQKGWKPRRSILFISWDANLYASSGVSHWLQEHHFEISTRTIAYIDLSRVLRGNETLHVHSSPILREVARKAISRVIHGDSASQFNPPGDSSGGSTNVTPIYFSSVVTSDEPSFAFSGNLGIPFMRICLSNSPKGYDYPLFHTSFDTFENFVNSVDPSMKGAETLGKIISEMIVLLADSTVLGVNVEDYVVEIQKAFSNFMTHYQEDLHKANLSIAYLQAAVMRLEVIGDNFRTEMHNRTVINPEYDSLPPPAPSPRTMKSKKALLHRIINDKLMEIDRTFLSRNSDAYKHQVLGFTSDMEEISINGSSANNMSLSLDHYFPKLKEALECGRKKQELQEREPRRQSAGIKETGDTSLSKSGNEMNLPRKYRRNIRSRRIRSRERRFRNRDPDAFPTGIGTYSTDTTICHDWHSVASQRIASLTRALDAASAVLQSPLLPEESE